MFFGGVFVLFGVVFVVFVFSRVARKKLFSGGGMRKTGNSRSGHCHKDTGAPGARAASIITTGAIYRNKQPPEAFLRGLLAHKFGSRWADGAFG